MRFSLIRLACCLVGGVHGFLYAGRMILQCTFCSNISDANLIHFLLRIYLIWFRKYMEVLKVKVE